MTAGVLQELLPAPWSITAIQPDMKYDVSCLATPRQETKRHNSPAQQISPTLSAAFYPSASTSLQGRIWVQGLSCCGTCTCVHCPRSIALCPPLYSSTCGYNLTKHILCVECAHACTQIKSSGSHYRRPEACLSRPCSDPSYVLGDARSTATRTALQVEPQPLRTQAIHSASNNMAVIYAQT